MFHYILFQIKQYIKKYLFVIVLAYGIFFLYMKDYMGYIQNDSINTIKMYLSGFNQIGNEMFSWIFITFLIMIYCLNFIVRSYESNRQLIIMKFKNRTKWITAMHISVFLDVLMYYLSGFIILFILINSISAGKNCRQLIGIEQISPWMFILLLCLQTFLIIEIAFLIYRYTKQNGLAVMLILHCICTLIYFKMDKKIGCIPLIQGELYYVVREDNLAGNFIYLILQCMIVILMHQIKREN